MHAQLCAPTARRNANEQIVLEAKDKIKERLGFSPDGGDALALTFAAPVRGTARPRWSTAVMDAEPI